MGQLMATKVPLQLSLFYSVVTLDDYKSALLASERLILISCHFYSITWLDLSSSASRDVLFVISYLCLIFMLSFMPARGLAMIKASL